MTDNRMTCADCDELLSGYLEDNLEVTLRAQVEAHATSCARCRGLIREIGAIRDKAAALPELAPSRDLWDGIEARIQPSVVSIASRGHEVGVSRRWLAVAAAALIVATSSVTYFATARSLSRAVAEGEASASAPVRVAGARVEAPAPIGSVEDTRSESSAGSVVTPSAAAAQRVERAAGSNAALASRVSAPATSVSELALSSEIARLQTVLNQRRTELDPATVKVIEDNLALIDVAVRQARAALSRDPASGFLNGQLDNALQKKVELLRTVALMPSST